MNAGIWIGWAGSVQAIEHGRRTIGIFHSIEGSELKLIGWTEATCNRILGVEYNSDRPIVNSQIDGSSSVNRSRVIARLTTDVCDVARRQLIHSACTGQEEGADRIDGLPTY